MLPRDSINLGKFLRKEKQDSLFPRFQRAGGNARLIDDKRSILNQSKMGGTKMPGWKCSWRNFRRNLAGGIGIETCTSQSSGRCQRWARIKSGSRRGPGLKEERIALVAWYHHPDPEERAPQKTRRSAAHFGVFSLFRGLPPPDGMPPLCENAGAAERLKSFHVDPRTRRSCELCSFKRAKEEEEEEEERDCVRRDGQLLDRRLDFEFVRNNIERGFALYFYSVRKDNGRGRN